MSIPKLYPLNDLILRANLREVVGGSLTATPLTTGVVTAFLATSNSPTATVADPSLVGSCEHVSGGTWRIAFDAIDLAPGLLASLFTGVTPYCIIQQTGGFRTFVTLSYVASRSAIVP